MKFDIHNKEQEYEKMVGHSKLIKFNYEHFLRTWWTWQTFNTNTHTYSLQIHVCTCTCILITHFIFRHREVANSTWQFWNYIEQKKQLSKYFITIVTYYCIHSNKAGGWLANVDIQYWISSNVDFKCLYDCFSTGSNYIYI